MADSVPTCEPPVTLAFRADQAVEYFSASRNKWYETVVVKVHADDTLDLTCRKNVDPRLVRPKQSGAVKSSIAPVLSVSNTRVDSGSRGAFEIGAKVEYYSDTMNGWVLSYVRGINEDGTYRLNSKKCADPSRVRALLHAAVSEKVKPPGPFMVSVPLRSSSSRVLVDLCVYKNDLCGILSLGQECSIGKMSGFTGGQNDGIWFISEGQKKVCCLKAVRSGRKFESVPSETENYLDLMKRFPNLSRDSSICFPFKVVQLVDSGSSRKPVWDVFAMRVAPGERLAEVIGKIHHSYKNENKLKEVFSAVGRRVREFHKSYGEAQHGDLQSGNIFVDLHSLEVTLIDLGMMGSATNNDFEYFRESIRLLAKTYGSEFERVASSAFSSSYLS